MAKKRLTKQGFSIQGFDVQAYKQTESYVQAIDVLYNQAVAEFARLASRVNINPDKPFSFDDYPSTQATAQSIVNQLASKMQAVIEKGSREQWLYACKKNDEFVASIINTSRVSKALLNKMQDRNLDALDAFQKRKVGGLDLSKRVWKYAGQFRDTMEMGIDVGIGEGKSAQQLSKDLRQNLQDPDQLFRRVRDKRGQLHLSKAAKAFHPGQGVYRSSYKNAMRLTRSEINMAYKQADQLRWQNLEFVVGYEVRLSNNHTLNGKPFKDICDKLAGRYPKNFVFKGWHPQCRCLVVPILQDPDEFDKQELDELKAALKGSEYKKYSSRNLVEDVPDNFKEWIDENKQASKNWSSQPYFIQDNFKGGTIAGGLNIVKPTIVKPEVPRVAETVEEKVVEMVSKNMPTELAADGVYLKGKSITFKKDFFDLIDPDKPIKFRIDKNSKGSYYTPSTRTINIADNARLHASDWEREAVIYHEFGHAIDYQRGLQATQEVQALMKKYQVSLNKKVSYSKYESIYDWKLDRRRYIKHTSQAPKIAAVSDRLDQVYRKIGGMSEDVFKRRGITKKDVLEQIGSVQDTIKAINNRYGWGHSTAYFKRPGTKETEFLAHAFENAFAGNTVFKKYLPELYDDMIAYVKTLK
jgi:hypothetical protein